MGGGAQRQLTDGRAAAGTALGGMREFSCRTRNAFHRNGVKTVGELCALTEREVLWWQNVGDVSVAEIKRVLGAVVGVEGGVTGDQPQG